MKKYDNYKYSGIEWIGEIPEHWEMSRLANFGEFLKGKGVSKADLTDLGIPVVLYGDIYTKYNIKVYQFERKTSLEIADKSTVIFNGDLLFTASGETKEDIGKCVTFLGLEKSVASGDVVIFRQNRNNSLFLSYVFNSHGIVAQKNMYSKGEIVVHIYATQLRNIPFVLPPVEEQIYISNYLDHKTTQIDSLISKKQQFITLLQEERIAVINQAVTKGLDPKAKMKDSGVEWLGEIPKHWELKRLKHVVKEPLKYGANEAAEEEKIEDPRYIRITDFGNDGKLKENTFRSLSFDKAKNFLLSEGDILFARSGATVGKTFLFKDYSGLACFAGYLIKASCNSEIMKAEFLYEFTNSGGYENWKQSIFQQSTIQNIGADKYNQLKIGVPPIFEQLKIIDFINTKTNEINDLITKTQQEIELLKEYKNALISEVVTGKVDVRNEILN
jgi:type I restriction enzyme S subunit